MEEDVEVKVIEEEKKEKVVCVCEGGWVLWCYSFLFFLRRKSKSS